MLGLIQGRIYYNLLNWYRVLALLPGFTFNRRFMEQMMGVRESLPQEIAAGLSKASRRERLRDLFSLIGMLLALIWNLLRIEKRIARFQLRLDNALQEPSPALTEMRLDELTAYYSQLQEKLLSHWDAPLVNDFFAMIFHGALRKMTLKWLGEESGLLANDAIRGDGGIVSAEPAALVSELARVAARDTQFTECLCEGSVDEVLRSASIHPEFWKLYESYLKKFGDRCLEELKLESETLHENPQILLRSVGELARAPQPETKLPASDFAKNAEQQIRIKLRQSPFKRTLLMWVLRNAKTRVRQRENLRFERTKLFGRVRRIFRECGRRLHAAGILQSPDDIFFLQVEEILGWVNGTAVTVDLGELAVPRKAEFAGYKTSKAPPDRFKTYGPVDHVQNYAAETVSVADDASAEERNGIGCCPGVVRGVVKVILDPRGAQLPAGRILVAEHTDPGWIMLFPSAMGLLVERGSLLSHSAIVARELGIPAVVSIRGLTHWLKDGDVVELDGARGTVRRIEAQEDHAE
jgi:pyruvate,water dikinase